MSQDKNNIFNEPRLDWSDQLSSSLDKKSDSSPTNNQCVKNNMPNIIHKNDLAFQWKNMDSPLFSIINTDFGNGTKFIETASHFESFINGCKHSKVKRLHFISFAPVDLKLETVLEALQDFSEHNLLINELVSQYPIAVIGCHRLFFCDGLIQLDLWLGDFRDQFISIYSPINYRHQSIAFIDSWTINFEQLSTLSTNDIDLISNKIESMSKSNARLSATNLNQQMENVLKKIGFIIEEKTQYSHFSKTMAVTYLKKIDSEEKNYEAKSQKDCVKKSIQQEMNIAIIGGGIASLCTALALAKRGKAITLYCAEEKLGAGASGNLQGALYPLINQQHDHLSQLFTNAYLFALNYYQSLNKTHTFAHDFNGLIQLGYDSSSTKKLLNIEKAKLPSQLTHWVTGTEVDKLAGLPIGHEGLLYPSAGWLSPRELISALQKKLKDYDNISILCNHRIDRITHSNRNFGIQYHQKKWGLHKQTNKLNESTKKQYFHDVVIIAAGMDTLKFEQCRAVPLSAARGQVSHVVSSPTLSTLKRAICHEGYLTPALNNVHCMGATFKRHDLHTDYRPDEQHENHLKLQKCIPNQHWVNSINTNNDAHVGIRCTTRDHFPYVGPMTDYNHLKSIYEVNDNVEGNILNLPDIYLITGLGSRGLCTAPLLSEVLASVINHESLPVSKEIYQKMEIPRQWKSYIGKNKPLKE